MTTSVLFQLEVIPDDSLLPNSSVHCEPGLAEDANFCRKHFFVTNFQWMGTSRQRSVQSCQKRDDPVWKLAQATPSVVQQKELYTWNWQWRMQWTQPRISEAVTESRAALLDLYLISNQWERVTQAIPLVVIWYDPMIIWCYWPQLLCRKYRTDPGRGDEDWSVHQRSLPQISAKSKFSCSFAFEINLIPYFFAGVQPNSLAVRIHSKGLWRWSVESVKGASVSIQ